MLAAEVPTPFCYPARLSLLASIRYTIQEHLLPTDVPPIFPISRFLLCLPYATPTALNHCELLKTISA